MNTVFLSVRVLHILLGAAWLGAAVAMSFFVLPAIREAGPDGGKVMAGVLRRRFDLFVPSIAGLTVVTGLYLYWHLTDGFAPGLSGTMSARVFGAGGVLGIVAAVLASAVVAKNVKRAMALMQEAARQPDAGTRAPLLERAGQLRNKAARAGRVVAILLIVTIMLMAVGRYV